MHRLTRLSSLLAALQFARLPLSSLSVHYSCTSDDVAGEVQGGTGVICGPRCRGSAQECPLDAPDGTQAQPQCVLQDIDQVAYCGLVCQSDNNCPSGASCRRAGTNDINLCIHPLSFNEWARQASRKKLTVAFPAKPGQSSRGFQIAKAYAALQSLKRRYQISDGDADVLVVKELLSATSASAVGQPGVPVSVSNIAAAPPPVTPSPQSSRQSGDSGSVLGPWKHDIGYFAQNMRDGLPGLEREVHDTLWNLEHINQRNVASELLRSVILLGLVYLVGGCAYRYYAMGARGLDMVPHIGLWMECPQLVQDGIKYSCMILVGQTSHRGGLQSVPGTSDRDTFAHFEPSK